MTPPTHGAVRSLRRSQLDRMARDLGLTTYPGQPRAELVAAIEARRSNRADAAQAQAFAALTRDLPDLATEWWHDDYRWARGMYEHGVPSPVYEALLAQRMAREIESLAEAGHLIIDEPVSDAAARLVRQRYTVERLRRESGARGWAARKWAPRS